MIEISEVAHVPLLEEVNKFRPKVHDAQVQDVSGDIRLLSRDVNSILDLGAPGTFVKYYEKFVNDVQLALGSVQVRLDTRAATIRIDTETPLEPENEVVSIDSIRHSNKRQACKPKTDVHYLYSASSYFDYDRCAADCSPHSSDSDNERRK